jgi:hypothetical protein
VRPSTPPTVASSRRHMADAHLPWPGRGRHRHQDHVAHLYGAHIKHLTPFLAACYNRRDYQDTPLTKSYPVHRKPMTSKADFERAAWSDREHKGEQYCRASWSFRVEPSGWQMRYTRFYAVRAPYAKHFSWTGVDQRNRSRRRSVAGPLENALSAILPCSADGDSCTLYYESLSQVGELCLTQPGLTQAVYQTRT